MSTRYTPALAEIRALLAGRTQADPMLDARDVWEELTGYPVPSLRTVRRLMEQVRGEGEFGRRGQTAKSAGRGQTAGRRVGYTYRMTTREIQLKVAELEARTRCFVDLDFELLSMLDAAAAERGYADRHFLARYALRVWLRDHPFRPTSRDLPADSTESRSH